MNNLPTQRVLEIDLLLARVDGMIRKENRNELPGNKAVLMSMCVPQIPHVMTWIRSRWSIMKVVSTLHDNQQ